jgi:hypothetical protein
MIVKRNIMKSKFFIIITLLSSSLSFVEIHSMSRWAQFKNFFTRKTSPQFRRVKQTKTTGKRFYSQMGKTARPFSRTKQVALGTGGLFGGGTLWSWLQGWWSGEDKEIKKAVIGRDEITSLEHFHIDKIEENPQRMALAALGIQSYTEAVKKIDTQVNEKLSLETKKNIARFLSISSQHKDTENTVNAFASPPSLAVVPALIYLQLEKEKTGRTPYKVPENLLSVKEFFPAAYTGYVHTSPLIQALDGMSTDLNYKTFENLVSQPIIKQYGIKNKEDFTNAFWALCNSEEYKRLLKKKDMLVFTDYYHEPEGKNTLNRCYSGRCKEAQYLTFGDKRLNQEWSNIYFYSGHKDEENTRRAFDEIFGQKTGEQGKTLSLTAQSMFTTETRMVRIETPIIKDDSIYDNKPFLEAVGELVKEYIPKNKQLKRKQGVTN